MRMKTSAGNTYYSESFMAGMVGEAAGRAEAKPFPRLSQREMDVALPLLKGRRISQICAELGLHPSTVATQEIKFFTKLAVDNMVYGVTG